MSEQQPMKINTGKYKKQGYVDIDGNIWQVVLPGAGTELRFSQASRACQLYGSRIDLLDKKINSGTITETELDKYEEYSKKYEENEKIIYDIFVSTFKDGSKDNSSVKKWINDTPSGVIILAFEDVKEQANNGQPQTGETVTQDS